ncbi:MAG: hypothetical protein QXP42_05320 [Candidatus Micrarchaeia archaeon]
MQKKKGEGEIELALGGLLTAIAGTEAAVGAITACSTTCTLGAATAGAVAATCPLCAIGARIFLTVGGYKKFIKKA